MNIFELTRRLVDIPSVTGEEKQVGLFLQDYLERRGWQIQRQPVAPDRFNVLATRGESEGEQELPILLTTHIDTVPPFFPSEEDAEYIYGRGSCDAKGVAAAMVCAAEELVRREMTNLALLFVVGEETDSLGALKARDLGRRFSYVIDGEPTDNELVTGHKGIVYARLQHRGVSAHSAYPELGDSAIDKLLEGLALLKSIRLPMDSKLGPSHVNVGMIRAGRAPNVIPDEATADVFIRTVAPSSTYLDLLRQRLGNSIEILRAVEPQEMEAVEGFTGKVVGYGTDIPVLRELGRPLLFGPGSIFDAHTAREKISKTQLEQGVARYVELVERLRARDQREGRQPTADHMD